MFCSNCGAEASGNFCFKCGARLNGGSTPPGPPPLPVDWTQELVYEKLIRIPEVREIVNKNAALAKKRLPGEKFLEIADKVISLPVSLETLGSIAQPIYAYLGVKTGKELSETLTKPTGTAIVAVLCSLARNGQTVKQVRQSEDGCLIEATLPSDIWSFEGELYVSVRKVGPGTRIDATTKIPGQMYDWGKSNRCLQTLFADLKTLPI